MTFAALKFQECIKTFFPLMVTSVPNKTYFLQPLASLGREGIFDHALTTNPTAQLYAGLFVSHER